MLDTGAGELSKAVGVRCEKGVLKPLEPVGLRKGKEVRIRIMRVFGRGLGIYRCAGKGWV